MAIAVVSDFQCLFDQRIVPRLRMEPSKRLYQNSPSFQKGVFTLAIVMAGESTSGRIR